MGWIQLRKYYKKTDEYPAYVTALLLYPAITNLSPSLRYVDLSFIQKRKPQKKYGGRQKVHHSTRFTQHNHYIQPQQHASPREEAIPGENQRESRSDFQGEWPVHCAKQGFRL